MRAKKRRSFCLDALEPCKNPAKLVPHLGDDVDHNPTREPGNNPMRKPGILSEESSLAHGLLLKLAVTC